MLGTCPCHRSGRAAGACQRQARSEQEIDRCVYRRRATKDDAAIPGGPRGCAGAPPSAVPRRSQRGTSHDSDRLLAPMLRMCVLLAGMTGLLGSATNPVTYNDAVQEARKALARGDDMSALSMLRGAVRENPD